MADNDESVFLLYAIIYYHLSYTYICNIKLNWFYYKLQITWIILYFLLSKAHRDTGPALCGENLNGSFSVGEYYTGHSEFVYRSMVWQIRTATYCLDDIYRWATFLISKNYFSLTKLYDTAIGYLTGSIILTTLSFIATKTVVSPWIFLLSSVPSVLSGGTCALITGIYCYISDVAKEKARALR